MGAPGAGDTAGSGTFSASETSSLKKLAKVIEVDFVVQEPEAYEDPCLLDSGKPGPTCKAFPRLRVFGDFTVYNLRAMPTFGGYGAVFEVGMASTNSNLAYQQYQYGVVDSLVVKNLQSPPSPPPGAPPGCTGSDCSSIRNTSAPFPVVTPKPLCCVDGSTTCAATCGTSDDSFVTSLGDFRQYLSMGRMSQHVAFGGTTVNPSFNPSYHSASASKMAVTPEGTIFNNIASKGGVKYVESGLVVGTERLYSNGGDSMNVNYDNAIKSGEAIWRMGDANYKSGGANAILYTGTRDPTLGYDSQVTGDINEHFPSLKGLTYMHLNAVDGGYRGPELTAAVSPEFATPPPPTPAPTPWE